MFTNAVNTTCINKLFSPSTIWPMGKAQAVHPQMQRIYAAAELATKAAGPIAPADLARLVNVSPQVIHNWEGRGPSKDALLTFQAAIGVNATWIETGLGPMFIEGAVCVRPGTGGAGEDFRRAAAKVLAVQEPHRHYYSWPFSDQLHEALSGMKKDELTHVENVVRAHLQMAPLARKANSEAA